MAVGHAFRETKLLKDVTGSLALHGNIVLALNGVILLLFFIESNFTQDSSSKLSNNLLDTLTDIIAALFGELGNFVSDGRCPGDLSVSELTEGLSVASCAGVNEPLFLHLDHVESVFAKMSAEVVLQHKELLFERVLSLHTVLVLDGFLPHAHELPLLEFLEEVQLLDVVVGVTLDEPLPERKELDRSVILIESEALSGECVVLLCVSFLVGADKQVVGITVGVGVQIYEYRFFLAL